MENENLTIRIAEKNQMIKDLKIKLQEQEDLTSQARDQSNKYRDQVDTLEEELVFITKDCENQIKSLEKKCSAISEQYSNICSSWQGKDKEQILLRKEIEGYSQQIDSFRDFIKCNAGFLIDIDEYEFFIKLDGETHTNCIYEIGQLNDHGWMMFETDSIPVEMFQEILSAINKLETSCGMATVKFGVAINEDFDKIQIYSYEC